MKVGFVVNDVATELAAYTTTRLAMTATLRGHEAWLIGVADFIYDPDGSIHARGARVGEDRCDDPQTFLAAIQGPDAIRERITVDDLDVLMLRNDPADDATERPWAQTSGILFGQLAAARGVIVLNDPEHLADAINKTYFQHFPEAVRPDTCISRNADDIKAFVDAHGGDAVIKPLQGSGGHGVFVIRKTEHGNLNQMIDAVIRDGYAIVQEYLPDAADGDVRVFVMNGRALEHKGAFAAFRRVSREGDARNNVSAGATIEPFEMTDAAFELVETVRPKLVRDGMHLVGLDMVGDKLMEINVFSPGGLGMLARSTGVEFTEAVIEDLERKTRHKRYYGAGLDNTRVATL
jgi:glutathione synthase